MITCHCCGVRIRRCVTGMCSDCWRQIMHIGVITDGDNLPICGDMDGQRNPAKPSQATPSPGMNKPGPDSP